MDKEVIFGQLGNGVTVWLEGTEEYLAHISQNRRVKFYKHPLDKKITKKIYTYARQMDPTVSVSQHAYVFNDPPPVFNLVWINKKMIEFIHPDQLHYRGWKYEWHFPNWKRIEKLPV